MSRRVVWSSRQAIYTGIIMNTPSSLQSVPETLEVCANLVTHIRLELTLLWKHSQAVYSVPLRRLGLVSYLQSINGSIPDNSAICSVARAAVPVLIRKVNKTIP